MHKVKVVLPPEGELYGFPKPIPLFRTKNDFRRWMLQNGYPQELIDDGQLDHCKYYEEDFIVE